MLLAAGCLALGGCGAGPAPATAPVGAAAPGAERALDDGARRWVDRTLSSLSLREKAAQTVVRWIPGSYVSTASSDFDSLAALVDRGVGGVSISVGLPHSYVAKLNALQRRADVPLLVTSDFESGGPGMRMGGIRALPSLLSMGGGTDLPPTMAFGAIGEERFARQLGFVTGTEARAVGVHLTFAPVVDVNSDPANPIINTRSFGEDPETVGRMGAAFVRGAREAGLMTTAKHFPGHGDTETDSHLELPRVDADRVRLDTLELVPFRHTVRAGVDAVMTAHIRLPRYLGPEAPAATFSPHLLETVLRQEMGFRGLVVTDALTMDAVSEEAPPGEAAVRALAAGADILLSPPDVEATIDAVVHAVRQGRIPRSRLDEAVRRVLEAKARAGLHRGRTVGLETVDRTVGREEHRAFADTAAVRSLTLPRDRAGLVPLDRTRVDRVLSLTLARPREAAAGRAFDRVLSGAGLQVERARVDPATASVVYDSLRRRAREADAVLLSVYLPPEAGAGDVALPPAFSRFARSLLPGSAPADTSPRPRDVPVDSVPGRSSRDSVAPGDGRGTADGDREPSGPPVALLSFGNPYLLDAVDSVPTYLLAWGPRPVMQRAAARALLGRVPVRGRLPVSLPPHHRAGEGLFRGPRPETVEGDHPRGPAGEWWRGGLAEPPRREAPDPAVLSPVDSLIRAAVADSVTPGAALAVGHRGRWLRLRGYGRTGWGSDATPVTDSTIYDLASLTKVVGTTTALMRLAAEGRVHLDSAAARHLPRWRGTPKAAITVGDLLRHRSGLPPHRAWWRDHRGRSEYRDALAEVELVAPPGDSTVYSDPGYMALGMLVEEVTGQPLDRYLRRTLFRPLGMTDTGFRPEEELLPRIAPTEMDTLYRDTHVHGQVHDENAHAMGGVAGHAGLFSSARDLAVFAQLLLDGGWAAPRTASSRPYRLARRLSPDVLRDFLTAGGPGASGAGWDLRPAFAGGGETGFSDLAFGHTGFTGTSILVDPEHDLFVVLLTSRVNPTRAEDGHLRLRRQVHRAVARALELDR